MTRMLALIVALLPSVALALPTLVVQVRTDLRPWTDFRTVRTRVQNPQSGAVVMQDDHVVRRSDPFAAGVRVVEQPLPAGRYRVVVSALDAAGRLVVERSASTELSQGVQTVPIFLTRPAPPPPGQCVSAWNRAKRLCGQVLAQCIAGLRGDRSRLGVCQEAHAVCVRSADRDKQRCEAGPQ
ncbi:MAG: hypothetical protein H6706_01400 [Myxococcales bacterium]|nr:hypothetical protein [Myxococcales bacterium]